MTHRRIHLWVSLVIGVAVWGAYFAHLIAALRSDQTDGLIFWFVGALGALLVAESVATGAIAWLYRRRTRVLDDGPTLHAALKASHVALMLLIGLVLIAAGVLAFASAVGWDAGLRGPHGLIIAANALLAMVVLAEFTRAAVTLALLPRT